MSNFRLVVTMYTARSYRRTHPPGVTLVLSCDMLKNTRIQIPQTSNGVSHLVIWMHLLNSDLIFIMSEKCRRIIDYGFPGITIRPSIPAPPAFSTVFWMTDRSPWTKTGLILCPFVSNAPSKRGTTWSIHCFPNLSIWGSAPLFRRSSSKIAWSRCLAKNWGHDVSQSFGILVEPQQVVTWNPYFPFGEVYECNFAISDAWAPGFAEEVKLWNVHRKKWPFVFERVPSAIGVGHRPGTARDISFRDSWH